MDIDREIYNDESSERKEREARASRQTQWEFYGFNCKAMTGDENQVL